MWRYNFCNGPNYSWREENTRIEIEPVQAPTEHSSVQIASHNQPGNYQKEAMPDPLGVSVLRADLTLNLSCGAASSRTTVLLSVQILGT
jgi:hypothetical protein